jgi:F420-0:gamma-glutamyl ligase
MGKTLEIPVAIIRGYDYQSVGLDNDVNNVNNDISIKSLFREKSQDLFRT